MPDLTPLLKVGEDALRQLVRLTDLHAVRGDGSDVADDTSLAETEAAIIFADIEGFSQLVAVEGDDVASLVLDHLDDVVAAALRRHPSARLIKQLGDGVMLSADDPLEAFTLTAQLPADFAVATAGDRHPLRLRAGAHHGSVRRRGEDLIGYHVNVAARVAAAAEGGQALVTRALLTAAAASPVGDGRRDIGPLPTVQPAGELQAKGVPEHPPLFLLTPAA